RITKSMAPACFSSAIKKIPGGFFLFQYGSADSYAFSYTLWQRRTGHPNSKSYYIHSYHSTDRYTRSLSYFKIIRPDRKPESTDALCFFMDRNLHCSLLYSQRRHLSFLCVG